MYTYAVSYKLHYVYILCLWCMLYEKKEEEKEVIYAHALVEPPALSLL